MDLLNFDVFDTAILQYFGIQFSTLSIYGEAELVGSNADMQQSIPTTIDYTSDTRLHGE